MLSFSLEAYDGPVGQEYTSVQVLTCLWCGPGPLRRRSRTYERIWVSGSGYCLESMGKEGSAVSEEMQGLCSRFWAFLMSSMARVVKRYNPSMARERQLV